MKNIHVSIELNFTTRNRTSEVDRGDFGYDATVLGTPVTGNKTPRLLKVDRIIVAHWRFLAKYAPT